MDNVLISIFICSCNYGIIMIKDGIGGSLDFRIQCFLFNCIKIYFSQNEKKLKPLLRYQTMLCLWLVTWFVLSKLFRLWTFKRFHKILGNFYNLFFFPLYPILTLRGGICKNKQKMLGLEIKNFFRIQF